MGSSGLKSKLRFHFPSPLQAKAIRKTGERRATHVVA